MASDRRGQRHRRSLERSARDGSSHPGGGRSRRRPVKSVVALPQVLVEVDGSQLEEAAINELSAVRVRQRLAAPAQCELTFHGPVETDLPRPGADLRVAVAGHDTRLFEGQVTAVEHVFGPDRDYSLVVRSYDALHR